MFEVATSLQEVASLIGIVEVTVPIPPEPVSRSDPD